MGPQLIFVTLTGLVGSVALLIVSMRAGRRPPVHRLLWLLAVIALGASIAFRLTLIVGMIAAGEFEAPAPIVIGDLAVAAVFVSAFWRPAWSGWFLMGTAVVLPAMNWVLELLAGLSVNQSTEIPMLGFYALPALITGTLLALSERSKRSHPTSDERQPESLATTA